MPESISFCCEALNGVVVSAYPAKETYSPHVGLCLSAVIGESAQPVVLVARLDPDEASSIGAALQASADHIRPAYEIWEAESKADGDLGE